MHNKTIGGFMTLKKKSFNVFFLVAFLFTIVFIQESYAKPQYCITALEECYDTCSHAVWPTNNFCDLGCNLGYLSCGS